MLALFNADKLSHALTEGIVHQNASNIIYEPATS